MRRTLVILRHAKAVRPEGWVDKARPLAERGQADAAAAGAWLAGHGLAPDLVICSTAIRTRETWQSAAAALPAPRRVRYEDEIYGGSVPELFAIVRTAPADAGTVLLIGHNPSVTLMSVALDPKGDLEGGLRTGGIAVHAFDGAWVDCGPRIALLAVTHTPRASVS